MKEKLSPVMRMGERSISCLKEETMSAFWHDSAGKPEEMSSSARQRDFVMKRRR